MKFFLFFLSLSIGITSTAQNVLKGTVTNQIGNPVPGARVFIENTTYGVITNIKGEYFIELKSREEYPIAFRMIGMKDTTVLVNITEKITVLNMTMYDHTKELETVEVSSKKVNVAKQVIQNMQKNRKAIANQFENYTCNTYLKTGLEKETDPEILAKKEQVDSIITGPSKMNFIESYALTKFKVPNTYQEKIIAHHDYSEKSTNQFSATISVEIDEEIAPRQFIPYNPYIFFEKIQDGDFNLYQSMVNLPKITEHPIVSPIGINAFLNYKFDLENIFYENEQKIYEIKVTPKFSTAPLFEGSLFILDKQWVIKSFELKINGTAMPFFQDFTVLQDYQKIDGFWVPVRREYIYTISEGKDLISANTRVDHSNYKFNQTFGKEDFNNELLSYDELAFDRDSAYWSETRPIQLKETELAFIHTQDSIDTYLKSEAYLDSIDAEYNKITIWDVTLNGIGFRNRFKQEEFYIKSLLASAKIFGVGGFRYGTGGSYSKKFNNAQKIRLNGDFDYGFNNKDLKGSGGIEYTFLPKKFGSLSIDAGNTFDLITNYNSVLGTFSRGNYVQKRFIELGHRIEIVNGLYGKVKFSYSDRQAITDLKLSNWSAVLFGELNEPQPFDRYKISMVEVQFLYRFKQKYIIKKNEKLIVGTKFPVLELTYKKGIPNLFDSEVNFDFIEIKASDEINLGNYGDSKWNVVTGSFLNSTSLRFMEHKFFRGSDTWFFSNPLRSHQLLDSTFHTPAPYFQGFYVHHFNGLIMNKIPLINRLKLELTAGASALLIQDANYSHAELFAGLEKKFKIRKQYFKVGVFAASRVNSTTKATLQFKIGFDFFNSYTNTWSY